MRRESLGEKIGARSNAADGRVAVPHLFRSSTPGEVGFAGSYPGRIQAFELVSPGKREVQRDASWWLNPPPKTESIAFVKKKTWGAGFFGGKDSFSKRSLGQEWFSSTPANFVEFTLAAGRRCKSHRLHSSPSMEGVNYDIRSWRDQKPPVRRRRAFLATLTGPRRVIVQSMTLAKMRRELAPSRSGAMKHRGLGAITSIFDNED